MKKAPIVTIGGSRALPPGQAPRLLIRFLASMPADAKVLLRRGVKTSPGSFENQVADLCVLMAIDHEWRQPEGAGREATFARDVGMVEESDLVLCFYRDDQIGDEESGTVNLVNKAMLVQTAVYAYSLYADLENGGWAVERVGEHDPSNEWAELVPTP